MTITRRPLRLVSVSVLAVALVASAFAATTVSAGAASSNKLTVTATEYTYQMKGSPKPGNVEVTFDNAGVEYHEMSVMQVKPGTTLAQVKKALASDDESAGEKLVVAEVSPLPAFLSPGRSTTTIVNLKAGRYVVICHVPAPDGSPHFAHGMIKLLDVKGSKSSYQPPSDGVSDVKITDSAIELPSAGLPRSGWVKVTNETDVPRQVLLGAYTSSTATFAEADAYYDALFSGQPVAGDPPADLAGGVLGIAPGQAAYFQIDLESGRYALVSEDLTADNDTNPLHVDFEVK